MFFFFPVVFIWGFFEMGKTIILSTNAISQDQILLVACSSYEAITCSVKKTWGALV